MDHLKKIVLTLFVLLSFSGSFWASEIPDSHIPENTDTEPPVITSPAISVELPCGDLSADLQTWYLNAGGATATDNNQGVSFIGNPSLTSALSIFENSSDTLCGNTMEVFVSFRAIDSCGLLSIDSTIAKFSSIDTLNPTIDVIPTSVQIQCDEFTQDSLINWINNYGGAIASDNCSDDVTWDNFLWSDSNGNNGFGSFNEGPYIPIDRSTCDWDVNVSFLVLDQCGNLTATAANFAIIDTILPVFDTIAIDTTINCNVTLDTLNIQAIDVCEGLLSVDFFESSTQDPDSLTCEHYNYTITRTWEANDICGNSISQSQIITVIDTIIPGFTIPPDITVQCQFLDSLSIAGQPTNLIDDCSDVVASYVDGLPSTSCSYDLERTWTITDRCGNSSSFVQVLRVEDNLPPVITSHPKDVMVSCDSLFNIEQAFSNWLDTLGGTQITSDCGMNLFFAAVPGSYNPDDPATFPGESVGTLDRSACPSNLEPFVRFETVDFVFYDECDNVSVTSASFGLIDTIAPIVTNCPSDLILNNLPGECTAQVNIQSPDVQDNCGQTESPFVQLLEAQIESPVPGDNQVIVDSLNFQFGPLNLNNTQANGNVSLILEFSNVDIDDPTEFFILKAEDGTIIDSTETTSLQCDDLIVEISEITAEQINNWGGDGFISFWLVPNDPGGSGVFAVNDVCGGSFVSVELSFDIDLVNSIEYGIRINQGIYFAASTDQAIDTTLEVGVHEVEHIFTDCSGNASSCFQTIEIRDIEIPEISCPQDVTMDIPLDSCSVDLLLPNDFSYSDNCFGSKYYDQTLPIDSANALLTYSFNNISNSFVANNEQFEFTGVSPLFYNLSDPKLDILLTGDTNNSGEYFNIYGDDGSFLTRTTIGAECGIVGLTQIEIPIDDFNLWAADGIINITAVSNIDVLVEGGGINPCSELGMGETNDGQSFLELRLRFGDALPYYYTEGATEIDSTLFPNNGGQPILSFNSGETEVFYVFQDNSQNSDTCSFLVSVNDLQDPLAICKDFVAFIHPSGVVDYVLLDEEIDNGSNDNCIIASTDISPSNFTCEDVGQTIQVTYTVTDAFGNSSSCQSDVKIESTVLKPSFSAGICEGDTLKLFANIESSPVPNAYTFNWSGPQNFSSNLENPIIINPDPTYSGTYTLSVEGFNGCISEGTVEVLIEQLVTPVLEPATLSVCDGDELLLNATSFTGDVTYKWYEGVFPSGILIESSPGPSIVITPTIGDHFYYVIVESQNCTTNPSAAQMVMVLDPPVATVQEPFITICEGDDIVLGTDVFNAAYTYSWTGPNNYSSSGQFPEVISNSTSSNQGLYKLVITLGSCVSDTANVSVVLFNKPEKPSLVGDEVYCQGNTIVLTVSNVANADLYTWYRDGILFNTTVSNTLSIPGATTNLSGEWTVVSDIGICSSDPSDPFEIIVEEQIVVGASNNGPLCEGEMLQLNATFIPNTSYLWEAPDGTIYMEQNPLVPAQEGDYFLTIVTNSGCESSSSTSVVINTPPIITALSNNSEECMDGITEVQFFPTVIPSGNYEYQWSGPNNFSSNQLMPIIDSITSEDNGIYTLIVFNQNCPSQVIETTIEVVDIPAKPSINGQSVICEGDSIILNSSNYSNPDIEYIWETPSGQIVSSDSSYLFSAEATQSDQGFYILSIGLENCTSVPSDTFFIDIMPSPVKPVIAGTNLICQGDTLMLSSNGPPGASYVWFFEGTEIFVGDDLEIPNVDIDNVGDYTVLVDINACRSELSDPFEFEILDQPITPILDQSVINVCLDTEDEQSICLSNETWIEGVNYSFYINGVLWTESPDQCVSISGTNPLLMEGTNTISVQGLDNGCSSLMSIEAQINTSLAPNINADLLEDFISTCNEAQIILSAMDGPPDVQITWSSQSSDVEFLNQGEQETGVTGLDLGEYQIVLSYSFESCLDYSQDTAIIVLEDTPDAINDTLFVNYNSTGAINIVNNDLLPSDFFVSLVDNPDFGTGEIVGNIFEYTADPRFSGMIEVTYKICSDACPDVCDVATIFIFIGNESECFAPTIITPNNDGMNDQFVIPCFSSGDYPNNEVKIFNQFGDEVFGAKNYRNDWAGTYKGQDLPVGTYYYVIKIDDQQEILKGFLILER